MAKSRLLKDDIPIESALLKIKASDKICRRCIIPEDFRGKKLSSDNVCVYCEKNEITGKKHEIDEDEKKKLGQELTQKLLSVKNDKNKTYDVAVGFSGGKDSSYLIWKLKTELKLNVLAIVIDHSYFPEIVKKNISEIAQRIEVDVFCCNISKQFMDKFFNYIF